jgi:hypothetical protein
MCKYLLERNMCFVPNIVDKRFITIEATRKKAEMSVKKQRLWITHVSSAISYIILDLDYFDSTIGKTLSQALMQMRSKRSPNPNLFVAVNTSCNGSFLSSLFKKDLEAEVNRTLPVFPLVLQHKMGSNVWNWFNEEACRNIAGYWWCPKKGVKAVGDDDNNSWGTALRATMTQATGPALVVHLVYPKPLVQQIVPEWNPLISRQELGHLKRNLHAFPM